MGRGLGFAKGPPERRWLPILWASGALWSTLGCKQAEPPPPPPPPPCGNGEILCGDLCVLASTDPDHCGGCDVACDPGQVCDGLGRCASDCAEGATACGRRCVDLLSDELHCGECDVVCDDSEVCDEGSCDDPCDPLVSCNGYCVTTDANPYHCGECNVQCPQAEVCTGEGSCGSDCAEGLTRCGDECVDLSTNATRCGSCDEFCPAGRACVDGSCVKDCGSFTLCGSACVDTDFDFDHCGGCDDACTETQVCNGEGLCAAGCASNLTNCDGACVDVETNGFHCGECGTSCGGSAYCSGGTCACRSFLLEESEPEHRSIASADATELVLRFSCRPDLETFHDASVSVVGATTGRVPFEAELVPPFGVSLAALASFGAGERISVSLTARIKSEDGRGMQPFLVDVAAPSAPADAQFVEGASLGEGDSSVALGDLDGDGDVDAVVGSGSGHSMRVLLNDGNGGFDDTGQSLGDPVPAKVHLADVDLDGATDLVASVTGRRVEVWLNDGRGTFVKSSLGFTALDVVDVAVADFNVDGSPDLFVAFSGLPDRVYYNYDSRRFEDTGQRLGDDRAVALAVGDVSGNGAPDVLVVNEQAPGRLWVNRGGGTFVATGQDLALVGMVDVELADFNDDGRVDFVVAGPQSAVWLNYESYFSPRSLDLPRAVGLQVADFDGDTRPDVWLSHTSGDALLLGMGDGDFAESSLPTATRDAAVADVNGDDEVDVVVTTGGRDVAAWTNR